MVTQVKSPLIVAFCLVLLVCFPSIVLAHRMLITPVEGDAVYVGYDDGSPSVGAGVALYDAKGDEIVSGTTDEQGLFHFDADHSPVRVVSNDGMGHRAEWESNSGGTAEQLPRWVGGLLGVGVFLFTAAIFYYINTLKKTNEKACE